MGLEERFSRGDAGAFESLFHAHQREVFHWIHRIVRDPAAAEDLTVESFWRAYQACGSFDPARGGFGPWMRRIATNAALKHIGRRRTEVPIGAHGAAGWRPAAVYAAARFLRADAESGCRRTTSSNSRIAWSNWRCASRTLPRLLWALA